MNIPSFRFNKLLLSLCIVWLCFQTLPAQRTIQIDVNTRHQTIHGFGASDAWNAQFVGRHWSLLVRNDIAKKLFSQTFTSTGSPEGIGLSRWRFNIGAGSTEQGTASNIDMEERRVECFLNADGSYDWNKQIGQQWFLQQAKNYGVEHLVAFLNSPPRFYTKNGRTNSDNTNRYGLTNLKDNHYALFADFMVNVLRHFDDKGLGFSQISPVNEPQYEWNSGQEGCPWNNTDITLLTKHLNNAIIDQGLNTKILLAEAGSYDYMHKVSGDANKSDQIWKFFTPSRPEYLGNLAQVLPGLGGHSYWTDDTDARIVEARENILRESKELGGIELYQTEYNLLSKSFNNKLSNTLYLAKIIHADLSIANVSVWDYWTAMERERWSQLNRFYLVRLRPTGGDYASLTAGGSVTYDKNLWALGNFSLFIRPGYQRIATTGANDLNGLMASSYIAPDSSKLVIVYVNWGQSAVSVSHQFTGIPQGYHIKSIVPYVTDSINNLAVKDAVQPGDVVGISSRSVTTFVVSLQKDITAVSSFTESRFKLYPNPANHSLRVFTSVEKPMLYSMVDLSGKRVAEGLLLPREENEINIRHLVKGWYLFQSDGFSERFLIE